MKKRYRHLKDIITDIVESVDLNYILKNAQHKMYLVELVIGKIDGDTVKYTKNYTLSCDIDISIAIMYKVLKKNIDRIIKIKITSEDYINPVNKNIIIFVPFEQELQNIKKEYLM